MKKYLKTIILPALLLLLGCEGNVIHKEYQDTTQVVWKKTDVFSYEVQVDNSAIPYEIIIELRHMSSMRFAEISTNLAISTPTGETTDQTYQLRFRDEEGNVIGENMAGIVDTKNTVEASYNFPQAGKYTFTISHQMEIDDLPGVLEVGLIVAKIETENQ